MDSKYDNAHKSPLGENFRYFLSVMAWLGVFYIGFMLLLLVLIGFLPNDPEWVEYCAEYYPELSLSSCRTASGGN